MVDIDEEDESVAYVAVQGGALPKPVAKAVQQAETRKASIAFEEPASMDWEFPEARAPPPGSKQTFTTGKLAGKTFIDVSMKHPETVLVLEEGKELDG